MCGCEQDRKPVLRVLSKDVVHSRTHRVYCFAQERHVLTRARESPHLPVSSAVPVKKTNLRPTALLFQAFSTLRRPDIERTLATIVRVTD